MIFLKNCSRKLDNFWTFSQIVSARLTKLLSTVLEKKFEVERNFLISWTYFNSFFFFFKHSATFSALPAKTHRWCFQNRMLRVQTNFFERKCAAWRNISILSNVLRLWVRKCWTIGLKISTSFSYLHFNCLLEQMRENLKNFFENLPDIIGFSKLKKNWTFVKTFVTIAKTDFYLCGRINWGKKTLVFFLYLKNSRLWAKIFRIFGHTNNQVVKRAFFESKGKLSVFLFRNYFSILICFWNSSEKFSDTWREKIRRGFRKCHLVVLRINLRNYLGSWN